MTTAKRMVRKRLKQLTRKVEQALPQNVVGGVVVGSIEDKPNYLQIRLANKILVEAFNEFCPPAAGLRVLLEDDRYSPGRWRICAVRNTGRDVAFALTKRHGPNHSWMGGDVTWIYIRQILPLRISVNASNALAVDVREGWWTNDGQPTWFATQTGIDLSTHRPTTGARWVLISISASNVITLTDSSAVPSQDLDYTDIPETPAGHYALAVVRLIAGARKIRDTLTNTDLHDLRFSATGVIDPVVLGVTQHIVYRTDTIHNLAQSTGLMASYRIIARNCDVKIHPFGTNTLFGENEDFMVYDGEDVVLTDVEPGAWE